MADDEGGDGLRRLDAYRYLTYPDRETYVAIMRVFAGTLLTDLSATELAEKLADKGLDTAPDVVAERLERLVTDGNLIPSSRVARAGSIKDYQRGRHRYQISQLGEVVQRQADEFLARADVAREVSRELLASLCRGLEELEAHCHGLAEDFDVTQVLERISTLFAQFAMFSESVRDFYAYLAQVLFRYDLDNAEFTGFKELLLDYVESITEDITRYAPNVEASLRWLWPKLPDVLARIDEAHEGLAGLAVPVQRSRGRDMADWEAMRTWFVDDGNSSEVTQLRDATLRALQALLANAKRMMRDSSGELSRRKDLLRLALMFDGIDDEQAHDLFVAAFGLFPSVHLGVAGAPDQLVSAATSWWRAPGVEVPISLRERGSRGMRGRTGFVEDNTEQQRKLLDNAEREVQQREAAAAELRRCGDRFDAHKLSSAATALLLELLAVAMSGAGPGFVEVSGIDRELGVVLVLRSAPGSRTIVLGHDGDFMLEDATMLVTSLSNPGDPRRTGER